MTFRIRYPKHTDDQNTNNILRAISILVLIIVISPLISCIPPTGTINTAESTATQKPTDVEATITSTAVSITPATTSASVEVPTGTSTPPAGPVVFVGAGDISSC